MEHYKFENYESTLCCPCCREKDKIKCCGPYLCGYFRRQTNKKSIKGDVENLKESFETTTTVLGIGGISSETVLGGIILAIAGKQDKLSYVENIPYLCFCLWTNCLTCDHYEMTLNQRTYDLNIPFFQVIMCCRNYTVKQNGRLLGTIKLKHYPLPCMNDEYIIVNELEEELYKIRIREGFCQTQLEIVTMENDENEQKQVGTVDVSKSFFSGSVINYHLNANLSSRDKILLLSSIGYV